MSWFYIVFLLVGVLGCGAGEKHPETEPQAVTELEHLREKAVVVKARFLELSDPEIHWPSTSDCDGLLWAGVARAAGVKEVKIEAGDYFDGRIGRRPVASLPCWTKEGGDQGSLSETSGDMAQGRVLAFWRDGDLGGIQRFADYGEAHRITILGLPGWILGEPYPDELERVVLRPGMVGQVGRVIEALSGGEDKRSYRDIPSVFSAGGSDFQEALTVRGIILFGEVDRVLRGEAAFSPDIHGEVPSGGQGFLAVDGEMFRILETLAGRRPADPLFQAAWARYSGDYGPAFGVLLSEPGECPSYARGSEANCLANWLFAASLLLGPSEG